MKRKLKTELKEYCKYIATHVKKFNTSLLNNLVANWWEISGPAAS